MDARLLADLQALIGSAKAPLIEAQGDVKVPQLAIGQRVEVRVVALLPEGRAEVKFGDARLNVNLPPRYGIGSSLPLTVVATTPRLQFALSAPPSRSSAFNLVLSDAAHMLGAARDAVSAGSAKTAVASPIPSMPISKVPPNTGAELAAPLRQAIVSSGYFYEAHQEQWVAGARSTASLRQEPQNHTQSLPLPAGEPGASPSASASPQSTDASAIDPASSGAQPATAANPLERIASPHTQMLVAQQLGILDGQPIVWQGEVWPGQKMRWEIEPEPKAADAHEAAPTWRTTIEVTLPRLGAVKATLSLSAASLALRLDAASNALADLAGAQADLRQRMANAGLNLNAPTWVERG